MTEKFAEVLQETTAGMPVKLTRNSSYRMAMKVAKKLLAGKEESALESCVLWCQ